ncbi:hypothetical protein QTV43_000356 [Vibrio vulnificus]|nr:hypothetical protein [Vibrio vulnificus]
MIEFSELVELFESSKNTSTRLLSKKLLDLREAAIQAITDPKNKQHANHWSKHKLSVSISSDNDT